MSSTFKLAMYNENMAAKLRQINSEAKGHVARRGGAAMIDAKVIQMRNMRVGDYIENERGRYKGYIDAWAKSAGYTGEKQSFEVRCAPGTSKRRLYRVS